MKFFLSTLLIFWSILLPAQQKLVFTKLDSSSTVEIKMKDLVKLSYNGYMQQQQVAEGRVSNLTDSTISLSPRKKIFQKINPVQIISLKDITGFRRFSKLRHASEIIYGVIGLGITGTVTAIVSKANLSPALSFATAAGIPIITSTIGKLVYSSSIKNNLNNGWVMKLTSVK